MPHLRIEYSDGLEIAPVCDAVYAAMVASGVFPLGGIRVRAHRCDVALVADRHPENSFVAMELSVGAGRSRDVLQGAGEAIFNAAKGACAAWLDAPHFMLSLEIREIDAGLSWKANTVHARLKARD